MHGPRLNTLGAGLLVAACLLRPAAAQPTLEGLPGHDRFQAVSDALPDLSATGRIDDVRWSDDGAALEFSRGGEHFRFDLVERTMAPIDPPEREPRRRGGRRGPARGRQATEAESPDGQWKAVYDQFNVVLERADGTRSIPVTRDGTAKHRYGTASWVYGEELNQQSAMWWSPDSRKLAFYEFDDGGVEDFYLVSGWTDLRTGLLVEGYPKAGEANPVARLLVYDVPTRQTTRIDVGPVTDQYVYDVRFAPDGRTLLFNRTNRHQNLLELVAADVTTGKARVAVSEAQRSWQDNHPEMRLLGDGERFIWSSEKTGFNHYELRHLDGRLVSPLTAGPYPAGRILRVDEDQGVLYYMAPSAGHPLHEHLHRVGLDGTNDDRLTVEAGNHTVQLSPDGQWFVDTWERVATPPVTALYTIEGEQVAVLAEPDTSGLDELGLDPPELFTCAAADGETTLYGILHKPSNFDESRPWPLLIDVYGGPQSRRVYERWRPANPYCEFGFLIAVIDNRGTRGRGKAFEEAVYMQLGTVDLDDQVAGVRHLGRRPYVDTRRVGIYGHSYGGYMSALAILKFPDVFHAASAGAPVTDWRNYDTIYTERYMRTPQENPTGYHDGSCLTFAANLEGDLLLMHGMVDDNVHPNNTFQLVDALQEAGLDHDVELYPTRAHGLGRGSNVRRWRFLYEHLIGAGVPVLASDGHPGIYREGGE